MKKKKSIIEELKKYSLRPEKMGIITGGATAANCDNGLVDTMGDPNSWTDTPGDCGKDPDACDNVPATRVHRGDIMSVGQYYFNPTKLVDKIPHDFDNYKVLDKISNGSKSKLNTRRKF